MRRALAMGLLMATACGGNDLPGPPVVKNLIVEPASATITVGATTQVTAIATDNDGLVIPGARVTWTSVTPAILSVSGVGVVTGLQAGQGTVRGASGGKTADVTIEVTRPIVATLAFDRDSAILTIPGGTLTLVPVAKDSAGRAIPNPTVFFSVDAPKVASVTQLGVVTALAAGSLLNVQARSMKIDNNRHRKIVLFIVLYSPDSLSCPPGNPPERRSRAGAVRQPDKSVLAGTGTYSGRSALSY